MLKKTVFMTAILISAGFFSAIYPQNSDENVIMLTSPEDIERFKMMLETEAEGVDIQINDTGTAKEPPKKITAEESEFKIYVPQPKEESEVKIPSEKTQDEETGKPAAPVKKSKTAKSNNTEEEFKIYIPQAKEEPEIQPAQTKEIKNGGGVIWLESQEDIEKFTEILQQASPVDDAGNLQEK